MRISDWSSDVCSSDLKRGFTVPVGEWIHRRGGELGPLVAADPAVEEIAHPERVRELFAADGKRAGFAAWILLFYALRSEDRRVGKECVSTCRSRWWPSHSQKKKQ